MQTFESPYCLRIPVSDYLTGFSFDSNIPFVLQNFKCMDNCFTYIGGVFCHCIF